MLASNVLDSFIWHDNVLMYGKDRVGYISEEISKGLKIERNIQTVKEGLFKINNVLIAQMNLDSVSAIFNFVHQGSPSYLMIPSVNYNGNKWGIGNLEPKGFVQNGVARSFEYRRVPISGATFSETPQFSVAMWGTEQKTVNDVHFSCSLYPRKDEVTHSLIYPDEELPDSYSGRDQYSVGYKNYLSLKKIRLFR